MSAWQLMQAFVPCADNFNFAASTNNEMALPAELVLESVSMPWQSRQSLSRRTEAAGTSSNDKDNNAKKATIATIIRRTLSITHYCPANGQTRFAFVGLCFAFFGGQFRLVLSVKKLLTLSNFNIIVSASVDLTVPSSRLITPRATIFEFAENDVSEHRIKATDRHGNIHHKAGSVGSGHAHDSKSYLTAVVAALKPSHEILIVGHGTAKRSWRASFAITRHCWRRASWASKPWSAHQR